MFNLHICGLQSCNTCHFEYDSRRYFARAFLVLITRFTNRIALRAALRYNGDLHYPKKRTGNNISYQPAQKDVLSPVPTLGTTDDFLPNRRLLQS